MRDALTCASIPRLYAILDAQTCARHGLALLDVALAWRNAGVRLLQYRDKVGSDEEVLRNAAALRSIYQGCGATLILNDRLHLLQRTGFDGLHVGQSDASIADARAVAGDAAILGISTHNPLQLREAEALAVDYVAVGPVFPTGTKLDAEPVVGLDGVRLARQSTRKPLVAIGGIGVQDLGEVLEAGADSVAFISALMPVSGESPAAPVERMLRRLAELRRPASTKP